VSAGGVLARLADELRAEPGLLADTVHAPRGAVAAPLGELAASGPRARGRELDYAMLVEAIHEGYLLHYRAGRIVAPADPDLALLVGDRLYALGLARLAALGDVGAVAELADVIALCAAAHARGDGELASAAWEAGAAAVGYGSSPAHAAAKRRARAGAPSAADALAAAARQLAGNLAPAP